MLKPVNDPIPSETREPIPAAIRPGSSTTGSFGPPSPMASMSSTAAISGEPKISETAANVPAAPRTCVASGGASERTSRMPSTPSPPPSAISGASGPSTRPSPTVATRGEQHPGQLPRLGHARVQAVRRHVSAVAGQARDRDGHHETGDGEHGQRPPRRGAVVEHRDLDLVDELEEPPRGERRDDAHDAREHEQHGEAPAADERGGVRRGCGGVGHAASRLRRARWPRRLRARPARSLRGCAW